MTNEISVLVNRGNLTRPYDGSKFTVPRRACASSAAAPPEPVRVANLSLPSHIHHPTTESMGLLILSTGGLGRDELGGFLFRYIKAHSTPASIGFNVGVSIAFPNYLNDPLLFSPIFANF